MDSGLTWMEKMETVVIEKIEFDVRKKSIVLTLLGVFGLSWLWCEEQKQWLLNGKLLYILVVFDWDVDNKWSLASEKTYFQFQKNSWLFAFLAFAQCGNHRSICSCSITFETFLCFFLSPENLGERKKMLPKTENVFQLITFMIERFSRFLNFSNKSFPSLQRILRFIAKKKQIISVTSKKQLFFRKIFLQGSLILCR